MSVTKEKRLNIQIFTRIDRKTDEMLDELVERQERNKSFILRKALEQYLQSNIISKNEVL